MVGIGRSGYVTVRSASGRGAVMRPRIAGSRFVRLDSLTLSDMGVDGCSTDIELTNSTFEPGRPGASFDGSACPSTTHNYLVDGVTFANVDLTGFEGRLNFRDVNGAVVRNSFFGHGGYGDGIQTQGGTRNLTIGPGNVFDGITQSFCDAGGGAHCDAIQLLGEGATAITGNYFKNGDTYIMAPDGSSNVTTTSNVFDGTGRGYEYKIQFGSAASPVFRHNTLDDASAAFDSKPDQPATTNAQVKDNIVAGFSQFKTSGGSGCSGCTFTYNLFHDAGNARGSHNLIGQPSFVGGPHPITYPGWKLTISWVGPDRPTTHAGWKLTTGSIGRNRASDGTNLGASVGAGPHPHATEVTR